MAKTRSLVGLDVHATKIVAAVLDADTGELQFFGMVPIARFNSGRACSASSWTSAIKPKVAAGRPTAGALRSAFTNVVPVRRHGLAAVLHRT
jgi:hypothetical protein